MKFYPRRNLRMIDFFPAGAYTGGTGNEGGSVWHLVIGWPRYGAATA